MYTEDIVISTERWKKGESHAPVRDELVYAGLRVHQLLVARAAQNVVLREL